MTRYNKCKIEKEENLMLYKTRKQQIKDAKETACAIVAAHCNRYHSSIEAELDKSKKRLTKSVS